MLELPDNFKIKIINRYGETGKKWLENIPTLIEKYQKKFNLEHIELIENLSINLVLFAKCDLYGDVVLKIGTPGLSHEIDIMQQYSHNYVAKTYYSSSTDKVQLLEKISPGYSLKNLDNLEERVKIFSELANSLLIQATGKESFETFENILNKRFHYAFENKILFTDILWMIDTANQIYHKIQTMHLPKYILHNDLHHKNILKTQTGWKAIDPHGIIGERVFECTQFIRSELENDTSEENKTSKIIHLVSQYFSEDKKLILEALYVYIIDKTIFYTKDKHDKNQILYNIHLAKEILNLIDS